MAGTDMTVVSATVLKRIGNIIAAEAKLQNRSKANLLSIIITEYAEKLKVKGNNND